MEYNHRDTAKRNTNRIELLGIYIDNLTMTETIREIENLVENEKPSIIFTPNVHRIISAQKNNKIKEIYSYADLLIPDGMPLIWASQILKKPFKEKVSGSDLFPLFCEYAAKKGYKIFLLGAKTGVAEKSKEILTRKNPNLKIVGTYSPPHGFEKDEKENERIITLIKRSNPDVLFLGLGFPKEENWLWKHKNVIKTPVAIGVGASFDFVAGHIKRAPKWMQRFGLEWFFRLCREPRRLWKRYVIGNLIFCWLILKESMK